MRHGTWKSESSNRGNAIMGGRSDLHSDPGGSQSMRRARYLVLFIFRGVDARLAGF